MCKVRNVIVACVFCFWAVYLRISKDTGEYIQWAHTHGHMYVFIEKRSSTWQIHLMGSELQPFLQTKALEYAYAALVFP